MRHALATAAALLAISAIAASPAMAGDPVHGKAVFSQQCAVCHSSARGGPTILGPTLFGVVGRPAGSVKGYTYSAAMKAVGGAWSAERLHDYLPAPSKMVPGNKMPYGGLKNPAQLDDLIAYLSTLK
ncbi:MAG: c-type cytochrome [Caulobacterales bacterium]